MYGILAGASIAVFAVGLILALQKAVTTISPKAVRYFKSFRVHQRARQPELFSNWLTSINDKIEKNNLRIRLVQYVALTAILVTGSFIFSMCVFKNFAASIFLSASFFIIPEHLLSIIHDKRKTKIEDQLVIAIRIFLAEFIQTPQIERSLAAVASRVGNPVGNYFNDAYYNLMLGRPPERVLASLAGKIDTEHGKMFVQLIQQVRKDTSIHVLFLELLSKLEQHIELTRKNTSALAGERVLSFVMAMLPIPAYLFVSNVIPESKIFITEVFIGRLLATLSFGSVFVWAMLDRIVRRVDV